MSIITERFRHQPTWAAVTEIFIGLGWLRAVVAKSTDANWWTGDALRSFLSDHDAATLGWYRPFAELIVAPNAAMFAALVLTLQLVAAGSLLSGRNRPIGLAAGICMNLHFVAAGAVNPSAFYLLAQGALALWLVEQRPSLPSVDSLMHATAVGLAMIGFNLPFIQTLDPKAVIDDPAIMMATVGGLTCLAGLLIADRASASSAGVRLRCDHAGRAGERETDRHVRDGVVD